MVFDFLLLLGQFARDGGVSFLELRGELLKLGRMAVILFLSFV